MYSMIYFTYSLLLRCFDIVPKSQTQMGGCGVVPVIGMCPQGWERRLCHYFMLSGKRGR